LRIEQLKEAGCTFSITDICNGAKPVELRKIFPAVEVENLARREVGLIGLVDIGNGLKFSLFQLRFGAVLRCFGLGGQGALIVMQKERDRKDNPGGMVTSDAWYS
jgi:hypothetical protein